MNKDTAGTYACELLNITINVQYNVDSITLIACLSSATVSTGILT